MPYNCSKTVKILWKSNDAFFVSHTLARNHTTSPCALWFLLQLYTSNKTIIRVTLSSALRIQMYYKNLQLHLLYFEAWYYFYYHLQVTLLPFSSTLGAEDYSTSSVQCLFLLIQISLSFLNWPCKLAYKQQCLYFYIAVRDVC